MELYDKVAAAAAKLVTTKYSSSFGLATRLFPAVMRGDIYNIYGLVRIADEIVDTYNGSDAAAQLDALELEIYAAIKRKYSANVIVHAFQLVANKRGIDKSLIAPFFYSMRLDTKPQYYTPELYKKYIDGSAEVVGLMCLKVFVSSQAEYDHLEPGARALGAAFQKVNFLRDLAADQTELQRYYFPNSTFNKFDDSVKAVVTIDVRQDFAVARNAIVQLPAVARPSVQAAYEYYERLLTKLERASANTIKQKRLRVHNSVKLGLLVKTVAKSKLRRFNS